MDGMTRLDESGGRELRGQRRRRMIGGSEDDWERQTDSWSRAGLTWRMCTRRMVEKTRKNQKSAAQLTK